MNDRCQQDSLQLWVEHGHGMAALSSDLSCLAREIMSKVNFPATVETEGGSDNFSFLINA